MVEGEPVRENGAIGEAAARQTITLFLCGDVMTGRGIDQILPHPVDPGIHESYMRSALGYVELAEAANGAIPRPAPFSYIWGDALDELERAAPEVRIVNLETSITARGAPWPGKGIHYRMHPDNIAALTAAGIDLCLLANNHLLDWGYEGLTDTLAAIARAGMKSAGAGRDLAEASAPAILETGRGRVIVFSCGSPSSGVPRDWAATPARAGVWYLDEGSAAAVALVGERVKAVKRAGDIVILSIHWGSNWGHAIPPEQQRFARRLIDEAGVDLVHGHSSHHVRVMEIYRGKLILYGCGDLLNDYEGIGGYEAYRGDLSLLYFPRLEPGDGRVVDLRMVPLRMRRFQLHRASPQEAEWLRETLNREGAAFGISLEAEEGGLLRLRR